MITAINGLKFSDLDEYRTVISTFKAGDKIKLTYVRDAKEKTVEVTLVAGRAGPGGGGGAGGGGGGAGGRRNAATNRPFLLSQQTGGQRANVQDQQGKDGFQTGGIFASKDGGDTWTAS